MVPLTSPRGRRALELRPKAIAVAQKLGSLEAVGSTHCLAARLDNLEIMYRTPFQRVIPRAPDAMRYSLAGEGRCSDFGFGIDVWWHNKKVLGIEWNEPNPIEVFSYRGGEWEREIEALAKQPN